MKGSRFRGFKGSSDMFNGYKHLKLKTNQMSYVLLIAVTYPRTLVSLSNSRTLRICLDTRMLGRWTAAARL